MKKETNQKITIIERVCDICGEKTNEFHPEEHICIICKKELCALHLLGHFNIYKPKIYDEEGRYTFGVICKDCRELEPQKTMI